MKTPFEIHCFYAVARQRNKRGLKTYFLKSTFHYVDGYNPIPKLIGSVVAEWSTDSFLVEKGTRFWIGANMRYQLNRKNSLQLFVGERRGGTACNARVCYEGLDFKGVELRLTSKF